MQAQGRRTMRASSAEFPALLWLIGVLGLSGTVLAAPTAPERSAERLHSYNLPVPLKSIRARPTLASTSWLVVRTTPSF